MLNERFHIESLIGHWKRHGRWWKIRVFLLLGFGLVFVYRIIPDGLEIVRIVRQIRANRLRVAQAILFESRTDEKDERLDRLNRQLDAMVLSQNAENQLSSIIQSISEAASAEKVSIRQIKPSPAEKNASHTRLPIELSASGTFHPLAGFINRLETLRPVMKVGRLDIRAESMISNRLLLQMRLEVYYLE